MPSSRAISGETGIRSTDAAEILTPGRFSGRTSVNGTRARSVKGVLRDLRRVTRRAELLEKSSVMPGAPVLDDLAVSYLAQRSMERWRSFPTPKVTGYARNRNTLLSCST